MLVDTDLHSATRDTPLPNTHDVLGVAPAKGLNSVNYITPGTNLPIISPAKSGQLSIVQTGLIAAPIYNDTAGANSYKKGEVVAQKPHNLSYTPAIWGYYVTPDAKAFYNMPEFFMGVGFSNGVNNPGPNGGWFSWRLAVDATYIYLYIDYLLNNFTVTATPANIRYYLLQQALN